MEIKTDEYSVYYEPHSTTVFFQGVLRLNGISEYQPIMDLLLAAIEQGKQLIIDLRRLEFLNSSGISMLSMFVVKVRGMQELHLSLQGSEEILWQSKSLKNLQRLMPSLNLDIS